MDEYRYVLHLNPQTLMENLVISHNPHTGVRTISNTSRFSRYVDGLKKDFSGSPAPSIAYPVNVQCIFHISRERKVSLSDLLQTVDGLLAKYQIVKENTADVIAGHDGSKCVRDNKNHFTEVIVTPADKQAE